MRPHYVALVLLIVTHCSFAKAANDPHPWQHSKLFDETNFTATIDDGIRIHVNAPVDARGKPARATRLIVFALPNGNTLEQTLGCQMKPGLDWHYDIQHIAAQTRLLRTLFPQEKIVLVCAEAPKLTWPSFRSGVKDANTKIGKLVAHLRTEFGDKDTKVTLTGHSGGGGFMFGVIDAADKIPAYIDRIAFLDANYSFDANLHGKKIADWLESSPQNRFFVVCYDDREITLNGKKVVGPTGGTYRATDRMHDCAAKRFKLEDAVHDPFQETTALDGRLHFYRHPNPENKILHTVLVGEMNGLLQIATLGTPQEGKWGTFGGPRAYTKFVQPEPTPKSGDATPPTAVATPKTSATAEPSAPKIGKPLPNAKPIKLPPRSAKAIGGAQFAKTIEEFDLKAGEAAILREITSGNFPQFLRKFKVVEVRGSLSNEKTSPEVAATIDVMPDVLAIGSDADFVRMPMTPQTAQQIADKFGCVLPTRKLVDAIDAQAELGIAPRPMTKDRESVATFVENNRLIEQQRGSQPLGLLLTGAKKDIVLTPRIFEKPQRLAIYGWRQLNGQPIQPLTIVHWDQYVDYSHGVRLIRDTLELDGKQIKIAELLSDPKRSGLISDEGPMKPPRYPAENPR